MGHLFEKQSPYPSQANTITDSTYPLSDTQLVQSDG